MILESAAFADGDSIPSRFTCDGQDVSPPLSWREPPEGTQTFLLIVDDPDAPSGTWVHWVLFNLPASTNGLAENASASGTSPHGGLEGTNGWGRHGYGGPCPPSGTHRYFFRIFALDGALDLGPTATAAELSLARKGRVLAEATLMGRYKRS